MDDPGTKLEHTESQHNENNTLENLGLVDLTKAEISSIKQQLRPGGRGKEVVRSKPNIRRKKAVDWGLGKGAPHAVTKQKLLEYLASLQELPATSSYVRHRIALVNKALELIDGNRYAGHPVSLLGPA